MLGTNDVLRQFKISACRKLIGGVGGGGVLSVCRKLKSNDIDGSSGGGGERVTDP